MMPRERDASRMPNDSWRLSVESDDVERIARALSSSASIAVLRELVRARRKGDGWLYLSQLAEKVGSSAGTTSVALLRLTDLVEEKREHGQRFVRSRFFDVVVSTEPPRDQPARKAPGV